MQPIQHRTTTTLLNEGEDIFIHYILPHLSVKSLCNCSQACKTLFKYAQVETLWKRLLQQDFLFSRMEGTYKRAYQTEFNFRQGRFTFHSIEGLPRIEHDSAICMHDQMLYIAQNCKPLLLLDLKTGEQSTISGPDWRIENRCIATNGNHLCIGYANGYIDIYNLKDVKYQGIIDRQFEKIDRFVFCNEKLVIKFDSNKFDIRDMMTRESIVTFEPNLPIPIASFAATEEEVLFVVPGRCVYTFNLKTCETNSIFETIPDEQSILNYSSNKLIYCNGEDIVVTLKSQKTFNLKRESQETISYTTLLGAKLLVKQNDFGKDSIAIWDLKTSKSLEIVTGNHKEFYTTLNKIFWKSIWDNKIKFYDFSFINNEVLLSNISNSLKSTNENKKIAIGQFHTLPEAIKDGIYAEFLEILSSSGIEFSTGVDTIFKEEKNLRHVIQAIENYIAKGQNSASIEQG